MKLSEHLSRKRCEEHGKDPDAVNPETNEPNWKEFERDVDQWIRDVQGTGED